jgi:hypothetical protein
MAGLGYVLRGIVHFHRPSFANIVLAGGGQCSSLMRCSLRFVVGNALLVEHSDGLVRDNGRQITARADMATHFGGVRGQNITADSEQTDNMSKVSPGIIYFPILNAYAPIDERCNGPF